MKNIYTNQLTRTAGLIRPGLHQGLTHIVTILLLLCSISIDSSAQGIGLHVEENHRVLFGADTLGAGIKLMWIPSKRSFLAGQVNGSQWDLDSIGLFSAVFGIINQNRGNYNIVGGFQNTISKDANYAFVEGYKNTIGENANHANVGGQNNTISKLADYTNVRGYQNTINLNADYANVGGQFNIIGQNAYFVNVGGAENTIGESAYYVNVGGQNNTISKDANYANVRGRNNTIGESANYANVGGQYNTISKDADYANVGGEDNTVGEEADYTNVGGLMNKALSSFEHITGRYADTTVTATPSTWDSTQQLFAIGNGTGINARNNALTVLKSGYMGINTPQPQSDLHIKQSTSTDPIRGIRLESDKDSVFWTTYVDGAKDYNFGFNGILRAYIDDDSGSFITPSDRRLKTSNY